MPIFKYKAKNTEGEIYEKTVEAVTRNDLYGIIRDEGGSVITIKEVHKIIKIGFISRFISEINTQQKITLAKNLGAMIKAGLSVTRALSVMGKQAKSKPLKRLLSSLESDISKGDALSDALRSRPKDFSSLFVSMVKAGEESGNVAGALTMVANQMEKSHTLVKKIRGALIYPAVILTAMVAIAILMLIFMVPTLTATFKGLNITLPLSTRIIIFMSDFLVHNILLVVGGLIFLIFCVITFLSSVLGRKITDVILLHIPVIGGIVKEVQSARTARTLSSLLGSGVDIVVALDVTIDVVQNHLYKKALTRARNAIQKGEPMSAIFVEYSSLYPLFVGEMVAVGEETGKISEMLMGVADFYEEEVDQRTKDLSTIIEPVLMIIIGIGVGIFAISMLAPTYSLVDTI